MTFVLYHVVLAKSSLTQIKRLQAKVHAGSLFISLLLASLPAIFGMYSSTRVFQWCWIPDGEIYTSGSTEFYTYLWP